MASTAWPPVAFLLLDDAIPAVREHPQLAGCCRPLRSPVRPLSNALRAFNTRWPWTPYGSGLQVAKPGRLRRSPRLDRRSESVPVNDVVPKINEGQVVSSTALAFPCSAQIHKA